MPRRLTLEEVLRRFKKVHGDKYDYSLIKEYKTVDEHLPIICPIHGVFYQSADKHASGQGCPKCAKNYKMNTEVFKERAHEVHGDKYDYSESIYEGTEVKLKIKCNRCGEWFWQSPHMHLGGQGCPNCYGNPLKTTEDYIKECKAIHGDKYDYSKTVYNGAYSKVTITCPIHGDFIQRARTHLYNHGCPKCSGKYKYEKEYFIERARKVHGDKYDYSMIDEIKNNQTKVPIICKKHGVFYQTPDNHINQEQGCPYCLRSKLEECVAGILNDNGFKFEEKKHFKWLGTQHLDFYLPEYNVAIECQGEQHLFPLGTFGSKKITKEELYEKVCELDNKKNVLCKENSIEIIYFAKTKLDYRYTLYRTEEELIDKLNGLKHI